MRLRLLQQFVCDQCGEVISEPKDGWLEWQYDAANRKHGFRIVHHVGASPLQGERPDGCYYPENLRGGDNHLEIFLGDDGLNTLLAMMTEGVAELGELLEIMRRLHLPCFEEARLYMGQAEEAGDLDGVNDRSNYTRSSLDLIVKKFRRP